MGDWQVGDLALCVKGGFISSRKIVKERPVSGRIYQVERIGSTSFVDGEFFALWLADGPINGDGDRVWPAFRFRKIRPHKADAEDAETIRLLTGTLVLEPTS